MDISKAIELLKEWVKMDRLMRKDSLESDYDKFCEERNIAIDIVLKELENSISKSKIEKKIEEEKEKINKCVSEFYKDKYSNRAIKVLEELFEEK